MYHVGEETRYGEWTQTGYLAQGDHFSFSSILLTSDFVNSDWSISLSPNNFDHVSCGRGNPAVSVPRYGERTRMGYRAQGDHFSGRNLGMTP